MAFGLSFEVSPEPFEFSSLGPADSDASFAGFSAGNTPIVAGWIPLVSPADESFPNSVSFDFLDSSIKLVGGRAVERRRGYKKFPIKFNSLNKLNLP